MHDIHGFSKKKILNVYKSMYLSRQIDEKLFNLFSNENAFYSIRSSGLEASQLAAAYNLNYSKDWSYLSDKDLAFAIGIGLDLKKILTKKILDLKQINKYNFKNFKIINSSSYFGPNFLHSIGSGILTANENLNQVVYLSIDSKDIFKGEFYESMLCADSKKLPIIFHLQKSENIYFDEEVILKNFYGFENILKLNIDGVNFFESYLAFQKSIERARLGNGPSFIISNVFSLNLDLKRNKKYDYNKTQELNFQNDPLVKLKTNILDLEICNKNKFEILENNIQLHADEVLNIVKNSSSFDDEFFEETEVSNNSFVDFKFEKKTIDQKINFFQSIENSLFEEFSLNNKIILCISSFDENINSINKGLKKKFSNKRVVSLPLSGHSLVGACVGFSFSGYIPIVKLTSINDLYLSLKYLKFNMVSKNFLNLPMIIRVPIKDYSNLINYKDQILNPHLLNIPNIKIVYPSNAEDAKGLLKMSCRSKSFVIFFENENFYNSESAISMEPDQNYLHPFGKGSLKKEGNDITIITYGLMVDKVLDIIDILINDYNISCEVIDLKCLMPLDLNLIKDSIKKTNKAIIIHEEISGQGPGLQLSAIISDSFFEYLDAPLESVGSKIDFSKSDSQYCLPDSKKIIEKINKLSKY